MNAQILSRLLQGYTRPNDDACWLWHRATDQNGYGRFWFNRGMRLAHRIVFELHRGPVPDGLSLDHLCRITNCVNPSHLEPVTHQENVRRGNAGKPQAARTHCPNGHEYTEANTYIGKRGSRFCRACDKARSKAKNRARDLRRAALK